MRTMARRAVGLSLMLAVSTIATSAWARPAPAPDFSAVTAYMDAGWPSLNLPGAALLVVKDGKVAYEKYFGAYTPQTVVPIASSSKWLSAAVTRPWRRCRGLQRLLPVLP